MVVASAPHGGSGSPQELGCGLICGGDGDSESFEGPPAGRDVGVGRVKGPSEGPFEVLLLPVLLLVALPVRMCNVMLMRTVIMVGWLSILTLMLVVGYLRVGLLKSNLISMWSRKIGISSEESFFLEKLLILLKLAPRGMMSPWTTLGRAVMSLWTTNHLDVEASDTYNEELRALFDVQEDGNMRDSCPGVAKGG